MSDLQQSTTRRIIGEAVGQLREHAHKLETVHGRVKGELDEAQAFLKAIEKAMGKPNPAVPSPGRPQARADLIVRDVTAARVGGASPRGKFLAKVIDLVGDEPRSVQSIADHFGSSVHYVRSVVMTAHSRGQLALDGNVVKAVGS